MMNANEHTPLVKETIRFTRFSSGDKHFVFIRGFYGLKKFPKGLPTFSKSNIFKTLIEQGFALV